MDLRQIDETASLVADLSFDQSVSGTGPFSDLAELVLRFKPVVAIMPMRAATSLPDLVRAILYFLIERERKVVSFEVFKPLVPGYGAKARCPGKIEPNPGATIVERDRPWT